jgi:hypothetical protein
LAFNAFFPPFSSASFQRFTDEGAAPIALATSRIPWPLDNKFAASRRLASNFSALPFGLIRALFGVEGAALERKIFFLGQSRKRGVSGIMGNPVLRRITKNKLFKNQKKEEYDQDAEGANWK